MIIRLFSVALALCLLTYGAVAWLAAAGNVPLSAAWNDRWNALTPLNVQAPRGPLTAWKFWRATHDARQCTRSLASAGITYRPLADSAPSPNCPLRNAVRVDRLGKVGVSSTFVASCPLALGLAVYVHEPLQTAAQLAYGRSVRRINHVGSYACRNVNHAASGSLSQHAAANAGYRSVRAGRRHARFNRTRLGHRRTRCRVLGGARNRACDTFHTLLGPRYDALRRRGAIPYLQLMRLLWLPCGRATQRPKLRTFRGSQADSRRFPAASPTESTQEKGCHPPSNPQSSPEL